MRDVRRQAVQYLISALVLTFVIAAPVWALPPVISDVSFPSQYAINTSSYGLIEYSDPEGDVVHARFDVADGRYYQVVSSTEELSPGSGELWFSLNCTSYGQRVTLAVTLIDEQGGKSEPSELSFTCGQPSLYNFDSEQQISHALNEQIPINIFILDDGVTSLSDNASYLQGSMLGTPRADVLDAIRSEVIPRLTGIWDQCGLGFDLVNTWVARPSDIQISGQSLQDQLFSLHEGRQVIRHGSESSNLLRQATFKLWSEAKEIDPRAAEAFNVIIVGSGILVIQGNGTFSESEGFSQNTWPNYALVRWGASLEGVIPKQMIATLAHELGHNLGLAHPGEDDLHDTVHDPMNLMKGSGVSPQPRASLTTSQCSRALESYGELRSRLESQSVQGSQISQEEGAQVQWKRVCPDLTCSGEVELEVEADGFEDLESFSFASFEYSEDGEKFIELGVDRSYEDGSFRLTFDSTDLADGEYTFRVVVTDARGIRATAIIRMRIENG